MNNGENFGTRFNFFDDSNFINLFVWFLIGPKSFPHFPQICQNVWNVDNTPEIFSKNLKRHLENPLKVTCKWLESMWSNANFRKALVCGQTIENMSKFSWLTDTYLPTACRSLKHVTKGPFIEKPYNKAYV